MRVPPVASIAILACLAPVFVGAERPLEDRITQDGDASVQDIIPTSSLRVHEWGVWQLDARGRVRSLEDVARESPAFVHRERDVPAHPPELPAMSPAPYEVYDKPVVFLYADLETEVTLTVRTPRGRPWLYYPSATIGRSRGELALRFTGRALPVDAALPAGLAYPTPPSGHWWSYLRGVGASPFVTADRREAERFLFYDGVAPFPRGFTRARGALVPIAGSAPTVAWRVLGREVEHLQIAGTSMRRAATMPVTALRAQLHAALVQAGLTPAEAESLLLTWHAALVQPGGARLIWLLPRASYDAMLPLEITPAPRELVRVGVVIEQL